VNPVFADSFYFFAILNPRDAAHARAVDFSRRTARPVVTTSLVLAEVADGLARSSHRGVFGRLVRSLRAGSANRLIVVSAPLFDRGVALYEGRPDKQWSLTDCVSFIVMEDEAVSDALTGDRHFEQAGFTALLK
jgi:predicted nucleic acid-binding protein